VEDAARDHRLRMLFPLPVEVERFHAASTFEVAERTPGPRDGEGWVQAPPATFPQQGFVCAGGLTVVAPGLSEAELVNGERNAIAITLLRCVGHLSRQDLASRPGLAGPGTATPGAQCPEPLEAQLALLPGLAPARARDAELGLKAVACGAEPLAEEGRALLSLAPDPLLLTALKPAEDGDGLIVRVLNPGDEIVQARLTLGFPYGEAAGVRLDEEPAPLELERDAGTLRFPVPPRALRSLRIR
jgi:alpha-mannosidase